MKLNVKCPVYDGVMALSARCVRCDKFDYRDWEDGTVMPICRLGKLPCSEMITFGTVKKSELFVNESKGE